MAACPQCGQANPDGFVFCGRCGAQLAVTGPPVREERKVVTVLFCDIVGSTARAEQIDPEDVRAYLSPFYARLRAELERFGGTVEKFIGDAVMAVFGAPVAHEDDPERAVRAALAIRDSLADDPSGLEVRIAVHTGEALVTVGARPSEGEGMVAGDVVNTTARLQSAAPVNGILVGTTTYRATQGAIDYREAEPVVAKGKSEPIPVWEALQARAHVGVERPHGGVSLVGRTRELDQLRDALARARQEQSTQLVTLVGVPGIGKSRLVQELFLAVEDDSELIAWRQARSLPYGEGITFWALAEMVKAQAGILETDSAEVAAAKLDQTLSDLVQEAEREWIEAHLRPLVGLGIESDAGGEGRGESFTAWRRFFEALAEQGPTVLVFEDLHWADDELLDFVDHLVEWAADVSLLVVCTARPELLERRPGWGGGKRNAATLSLAPLDDDETATLIRGLLQRALMPAEPQAALLVRAGGNPLYAEQYVRMLAERRAEDELALPETLQGIIAARLDALPLEEKALLQDASVLGKLFWVGALTELGTDGGAVERDLHALTRKEFVRRGRQSSVAGETEYAFGHVLIRDVAYAQMPRAVRAEKHRIIAEWLEALSADRTDDRAEMLAHHYLSAIEFAAAAGQPTGGLETRARRWLSEAADRALALNAFAAARRFYEAALESFPADAPERPGILLRYAKSRPDDPEMDDSVLLEAHEGLARAGDPAGAAEAQALLAFNWWSRGSRARAEEHLRLARALVENEPASPAKAHVVAGVARLAMLGGKHEEAVRLGREAIVMADVLGLPALRARALNTIGTARASSGDWEGLADIQRAIEVATEANSLHQRWHATMNLAACLAEFGELRRATALQREANELARQVGHEADLRWTRAEEIALTYHGGEWEESARLLGDFMSEIEGTREYMEFAALDVRAHMQLARGAIEAALEDSVREVELVRAIADPQALYLGLATHAACQRAAGRLDRAREIVEEVLAGWRDGGLRGMTAALDVAWVLRGTGREGELLELIAATDLPPRWFQAARGILEGDLVGAADICAEIGSLPDEAYTRLRAAEAFASAGRRADANRELQRALHFWRSVGATAYVREGEALLAATA